MNDDTIRQDTSARHGHGADEIEEFAGGEIRVRHGIVNLWLIVVYAGLFAWSLYYLVAYWGGLGPGLAY